MDYRIEHDSMGEVQVPADRYWGAQTQRSHENFEIGVDIETMPREVTHAFGILKKAAAQANAELKPEKMTAEKLSAIETACDECPMGGYEVTNACRGCLAHRAIFSPRDIRQVLAGVGICNRQGLERRNIRKRHYPEALNRPREVCLTAYRSVIGRVKEHSDIAIDNIVSA